MSRRVDIRRSNGQTMVEFVLVLPILMLVLFAIIQFGMTFTHYVTLTDAVRAGARTAATSRLSPTRDGDIKTKVSSSSDGLIPTNAVQVTSTWAHGTDVQVKATVPYSISLLGLVIASGNLSSTTTERVE
jgi:Flp pilus assembly protein TadG